MAGMQDSNRIRAGFAVAVAIGLAGVLVPATAAAADAYVDDSSLHSGAPCSLLDPCSSIATGILQASSGGTVHVDGGTYNEHVILNSGKSLIGDDFNAVDGGSTQATINGAGFTAIKVNGSDAGTIQGLAISSDNNFPVQLDSAATVTHNTVNLTAGVGGARILLSNSAASGSSVTGNTITGSTTGGILQVGIDDEGATATIAGNTVTNAAEGIFVGSGGDATVTANTISGTHTAGSSGTGIAVGGSHATIAGNLIHLPGTGTNGMDIFGGSSASISRTSVIGPGFQEGIRVEESTGPVTLDSDVITGAADGILAKDDAPFDDGGGDVSVSNVTDWGNGFSGLTVINANVAIDSSLLEQPLDVTATSPGDVACTITFSRGPTTTPGGDGCANFQTTAAPDLGGSDGFHLLDTPNNRASFIDHGNPAGAAGSLDLGGLPRRIDADGACPLSQVLDLGAYELQVAQPNCAPPPSSGGSNQPPVAQPRKCKKHKKRSAASQAKKKKCKHRK
jgi:parallel beta-helix repeat protein